MLTILATTILFLLVTLTAIYMTSYQSLKNQGKEMLERYAERYSLEDRPDGRPPAGPADLFRKDEEGIQEGSSENNIKEQGGALEESSVSDPEEDEGSLPEQFEGTTALGPQGNEEPRPADGVLYKLSSFYSVAYSGRQEILAVDTGWGKIHTEEEIIGLAEGILKEGKEEGNYEHMLYRVEKRDGYTLVAFMDNLLMEDSMGKVLVNTLIVGLISVILFFAAAVILARHIIRPLEENDLKQKQFVSDAGHELKTPISVISTNAELLYRQIGDNQWLSNISYENERMGNLVKELLMLSRAENSAFIFELLDLSKLVQQEVLPFESVAFENGLELVSHICEGITVKGNRSQLGQLISILTDNAISYNEGGKRVTVSLKKRHRQAILSVENFGREVPVEMRERLFDRFYRSDESRGESEGHFGLGLSIARAITDSHHGKISLDCMDGRVVFTVTLLMEKLK